MIKLPVILNPISRRKDRSVKMSYETRELTPTEIMTLMAMEGEEGWLIFAPQEAEIDLGDVPKEKAEVGIKSNSELLRNALYAFYKQETKEGKYIGLFPSFYELYLEKYRQHIISKLHD